MPTFSDIEHASLKFQLWLLAWEKNTCCRSLDWETSLAVGGASLRGWMNFLPDIRGFLWSLAKLVQRLPKNLSHSHLLLTLESWTFVTEKKLHRALRRCWLLKATNLGRDGSYVVSYKIRSITKGFHRHELESLDLKLFLPPQYQVQRIQNHFQKFHRCSILGDTASYYAVNTPYLSKNTMEDLGGRSRYGRCAVFWGCRYLWSTVYCGGVFCRVVAYFSMWPQW